MKSRDNRLTDLSRPDDLSSLSELSKFMQMQGLPTRPVVMMLKQHTTIAQPSTFPAATPQPEVKANGNTKLESALAMPNVNEPERSRSIIISSDMTMNRHLLRHIVRALPNLDIIERNNIVRSDRKHITASKQSNRYDADISISPCVGLVTTSLQKLKQKPLPRAADFLWYSRTHPNRVCPVRASCCIG